MKIVIKVLGYADADGSGDALLKEFSESDFSDAKRLHKYPKGVKHLKMFRCEEIECAIFISDEVAATVQESQKARDAKAAEAKDKAAELSKAPAEIVAAQKKVQDTARKRNALMGQLHSLKTNLRNHEVTPENLRSKTWASALKEIQIAIMGDPEKKISGMEAQVADSIAAYDKAAAELAALIKPVIKTISPEPKSQFVEA